MIKVATTLLVVCATVFSSAVDHVQLENDDSVPVGERILPDDPAIEGVKSNLDGVDQDINEESLKQSNGYCPYGMAYWSGQNHCYSFSRDDLTWYDAITTCEIVTKTTDSSQNGWLAHLSGQSELNFFKSNTCGDYDYWVGGTDIIQHGDFQWYKWRAISNWFGSCKPAAKGYAQCAYIRNGRMYADKCSERKRFICERRR